MNDQELVQSEPHSYSQIQNGNQMKLKNRRGSAVAWWLMPRTPDPEVGVSSPIRVKPCCVLEQGTFTPQKYW